MISNPQTVLALLPAAVRRRVEELVLACAAAVGEHLVSVVVYGSAVRGGFTPRSDVDLLLVIDDDHPDLLRRLHDPITIGHAAARIDCRILLASEIPKSADVFPVLYDDVRGCHAILFGRDPFADLVIHDEHRRLRVEQELRDLRIRLRRLIADTAFDEPLLRDGLDKKLKHLRAPLASLLRLHGLLHKGNDDVVTVLDVLGQRYKLDTQPLTQKLPPTAAATTQTALALRALLDAAIADVDALQVPAADAAPRTGGAR